MKNFFILQLLLLLAFSGNMIGMQRTIRSLASRNICGHLTTKASPVGNVTNNIDSGHKQEAYITPNIQVDPYEDKMAFYKKCSVHNQKNLIKLDAQLSEPHSK